MDQRQKEFESKLKVECPNVYFQPPPNIKLKYPCIVYKQAGDSKQYADNIGYIYKRQWMVTCMNQSPFDKASERLALWPMCEFNRAYASNGINHTVYYIYY